MNRFSNKQTQHRATFVLCALLLSVMVFSSLFIVFEHDHDCSGDDCPICVMLQQAEKNVTCLGEAENGGMANWILPQAIIAQAWILPSVKIAIPLTLIHLKVRQNK